MAVGALHRRGLAPGIFRLVASDTQPGAGAGIMKYRLQAGRHRWSGWLGMAIGAELLRSLQWLCGSET